MTVRRIKSYSAETGYVYQYHFAEARPAARPGLGAGTEYVFAVSRDRKSECDVPIFVAQQAMDAWAARHGRPLNGTEQYAAAKMRLFRAFDESEALEQDRLRIEVTRDNLDALLAALDLT